MRSREFLVSDEGFAIPDNRGQKEWRFFHRAERLLLGNVSLRALAKMFESLKEI
jgi:hypothetical protein